MKNKIIAIMYDFDKTLSTKDMQEYSFIPNLGINAKEFWEEANKIRLDVGMDRVLVCMYLMFKKTIDNNQTLKRDYLNKMGNNIELYPGVIDWFKRINEYGESKGFKIEHYIISSGLKEIIEGCPIGKEFKYIYASEFYYNQDGNVIWPKLSVNYTDKTQFLMRISKGILDISDDVGINRKMLDNERRISFSNMIYIGDGFTDVPCMKLTNENGGVSIAVYKEGQEKTAEKLLKDGRINYMISANYSKNSQMEDIVMKVIDSMAINTELTNITALQKEKR